VRERAPHLDHEVRDGRKRDERGEGERAVELEEDERGARKHPRGISRIDFRHVCNS